jgi:hypothetical protein
MAFNLNMIDVGTNEIVELSGGELQEVAGGPQEENIPPPR